MGAMKKQQRRGAPATKKVETGGGRMASAEPEQSAGVFDLERLRDLIELMREYDLREVDLKQDKQHIRLSRGTNPDILPVIPGPVTPPTAAASKESPAPTPPPVASAASGNVITIDSPMVGTFYSRPNPDAESFVKVGDHIGPETVVCIIEAMKVFNEIQAEVSGKVVAVLANNEESVDFGRPLFKIDTSA